MLKRCLLFAALALLTSPAMFAQRKPGTFTIYGEGTGSCGEWTSARSGDDHRAALITGAWVLGFASGVGWANGNLKHTDAAGIEAWMDNYCRANPLKVIADGAAALVGELAQK